MKRDIGRLGEMTAVALVLLPVLGYYIITPASNVLWGRAAATECALAVLIALSLQSNKIWEAI